MWPKHCFPTYIHCSKFKCHFLIFQSVPDFTSNCQLEVFGFCGNSIPVVGTSIPSGRFCGNANLTDVRLREAGLTGLPVDIFPRPEFVEVLDLSLNKLTHFPRIVKLLQFLSNFYYFNLIYRFIEWQPYAH